MLGLKAGTPRGYHIMIVAYLAATTGLLVKSYLVERADHNWGALGMIILVNPAASLVLSLIGIAGYWHMNRVGMIASQAIAIAVMSAPALQRIGNVVLSTTIDMHGC